MKTTKAYMRSILRTLQKMQVEDGFGRSFEIKTNSYNGIAVIHVTFVYPNNKTDESQCEVLMFDFYEFYDKDENNVVLTEIQNHINGHSKTK